MNLGLWGGIKIYVFIGWEAPLVVFEEDLRQFSVLEGCQRTKKRRKIFLNLQNQNPPQFVDNPLDAKLFLYKHIVIILIFN